MKIFVLQENGVPTRYLKVVYGPGDRLERLMTVLNAASWQKREGVAPVPGVALIERPGSLCGGGWTKSDAKNFLPVLRHVLVTCGFARDVMTWDEKSYAGE